MKRTRVLTRVWGRIVHAALTVVFMVFFAVPAAAQNLQMGAHFKVGLPQNEFSDHVDNNGYGVSGYIGYRLGESPVLIGTELGFLIYGREIRHEPFSMTVPEVTVRVTTTNSIFLWHALLRLQADRGTIQPFVDGLVGFGYLFTRTSINSEHDFGEPFASSTNFDDAAFSYGTGGGIRFSVYERTGTGHEIKLSEVLVEFRFRYLFGAEAEYLKKGSIERDQGTVYYDVERSKTDLLIIQIGVGFKL